jgi:hypothetical protein
VYTPVSLQTYLLSANFNASDVTFADTNDVETVAPGSVQVGALTIDQSGTSAADIISNKMVLEGNNTDFRGMYTSSPVTRQAGLLLKGTLQWSQATSIPSAFQLINTAHSPTSTAAALEVSVNANYAGSVSVYGAYDGSSYGLNTTIMPSHSADTDYTFAIVMGGWDSSGVPSVSDSYGSSVYQLISGDWTLVAKTHLWNNSPLYFRGYSYTNGNVSRFDDVMLCAPDTDLINTFKSTHMSLFNASNGTLLTAYTPDTGNVWTDNNGVMDIQSNSVKIKTAAASPYNFSTTDTGIADFYGVAHVVPYWGATTRSLPYVVHRYTDNANNWQVLADPLNNNFRLFEVNTGVATERGIVNVTVTEGNTYRITSRIIGDVHTVLLDNANEISYTSSVFNTNTKHGIRIVEIGTPPTDGEVKDFTIWSTTGAQYDVLNNYTGAT